MPYLFYEREVTTSGVKTVSDLNVPAKATGVEIQADGQAVRYTCDGQNDPTSTSGMLFLTTSEPKYFLIEDFKQMRFIQGAGGAGALNFHYHAGRDI